MRPETKTKHTRKNKSPSITNNQFIYVSNKKSGVSTNEYIWDQCLSKWCLSSEVHQFSFWVGIFWEQAGKKLRIKTLLREGEPGAASERRQQNNWWIGLINECFSARGLVLEVETGGLTTTDWRGSTQTQLHVRCKSCCSSTGIRGSLVSTNQIGSSFSGGEQDLGFFAISHWCWLSHRCRLWSCFYKHLQRNINIKEPSLAFDGYK